jgi:AraC family transcriptional activator of pobA
MVFIVTLPVSVSRRFFPVFIRSLQTCRGIGVTGQPMVKTGHMTVIRQMTYQPVGHGASAVETMTFDRLRELNDGGTQRADFHVLAFIDAGHGAVTVDFLQHPSPHASSATWPPGRACESPHWRSARTPSATPSAGGSRPSPTTSTAN